MKIMVEQCETAGAEGLLNHEQQLIAADATLIRQFGAFSYKFAGNACTRGDQSPVV